MTDSSSSSSSGSSDREGEGEYVLYCHRREWADVQPIPQDDGPNPVVTIAYTDKFHDVYDYLRAVMRTQEKSERVLQLTADAIHLNAANYTVWHYRRQVLQHLRKDLKAELMFTAEVIAYEAKNYQVWHHRQKIVEWTGDPSEELTLTAAVLQNDSKNYHAWQHRQWVVRNYSLWQEELVYVDKLLLQDLRNNSAWNHRYFVVANTDGFSSEEIVRRELDYAIGYIRRAPNNESPWNYLHGVLKGRKLSEQSIVRELCSDLVSKHIASPHLLATMVDLYGEEAVAGRKDSLDKALELCERLATKVDQIRASYWWYTARRLEQAVSESSRSTHPQEQSVEC